MLKGGIRRWERWKVLKEVLGYWRAVEGGGGMLSAVFCLLCAVCSEHSSLGLP